jgi:hypothetical protein
MSQDERQPADLVRGICQDFIELLRPACQWIEVGGSLRRGEATVGDVELVAIPERNFLALTDYLVNDGTVTKARYGPTQKTKWGKRSRGMVYGGVKFDVYLCDENNRGYIHWLRTGPDSTKDKANTYLMSRIKKNAPFRVETWVYQGDQMLRINTEEDWFALCGIPFIEPSGRSTRAYIKAMGKKHRWGNPQDFIVRQATLFDLDKYLAAEFHKNLDSGVKVPKPPAPPWQWEAPWLTDDGLIWYHEGEGRWSPDRPESERVGHRLELLRVSGERYRRNEAARLRLWLAIQAANEERERMRMLAEVLDEAFGILWEREEEYV